MRCQGRAQKELGQGSILGKHLICPPAAPGSRARRSFPRCTLGEGSVSPFSLWHPPQQLQKVQEVASDFFAQGC